MRLTNLSAYVVFFLSLSATGLGDEKPDCRLVLMDRQIAQHNSRWSVRYEVSYEGDQSLDLSASDVGVRYEGWVANSRCPSHGVPRKSQAQFTLAETNPLVTPVINSTNEKQRCRERIALAVSTSEEPPDEPSVSKTAFLPLRLSPGQRFWLYLILEHDHFLHGTYDPLLGAREVEFQIGPCRLLDSVPLDQEQAPAAPQVKLSAPSKERLDDRQYRSAPDSLYLAADVPGFQYFRFDDMPVRYGTRFRLSFWYLVAVGTEGTCHARVMEYQDTPNAWYRLDGGFDEQLPVQGRWQRFEQTFRTMGDTTTMALDFRIVGANVGELWIDDVELVPLYAESDKP